jgi:Trk K+ transport system NAD-binding subunit
MGKCIEDVAFNEYNIILFGIQNGARGKFKFNPPKDYIIKDDDILVVMGHKLSLSYFKKKFNIVGKYRW